jgi:hypothetical protein
LTELEFNSRSLHNEEGTNHLGYCSDIVGLLVHPHKKKWEAGMSLRAAMTGRSSGESIRRFKANQDGELGVGDAQEHKEAGGALGLARIGEETCSPARRIGNLALNSGPLGTNPRTRR